MAFSGKWETVSQDGYEEFCKLIGKLQLFKQLIFALLMVESHTLKNKGFLLALLVP